jgi:hypothetical protein
VSQSLRHSHPTEKKALPELTCRAEFIFDALTRTRGHRPIKVVGEYICDCRRPDWEQRWRDWSSRQNPYLNLFLCEEHARMLGLVL